MFHALGVSSVGPYPLGDDGGHLVPKYVIGRRAVGQDVIAAAADEHVRSQPADENVSPGIAGQLVGVGVANQDVVAAAPDDVGDVADDPADTGAGPGVQIH